MPGILLKGTLMKGDTIAKPLQDELTRELATRPRVPKILAILGTSGAPSRTYAEFTKKACVALGFDYVLYETGAAIPESGLGEGEGVKEAILKANDDPEVDGIMVYYPIFGGKEDQDLQQLVSPFKDVEGMHFRFHNNMYNNVRFIEPKSLLTPMESVLDPSTTNMPPPGMVESIVPCTPLAVVKSLEHCGVFNTELAHHNRAHGRTIVVINRSEVVGRPLAALLADTGARVLSVDIDSIQEFTNRPAHSEGSTVSEVTPKQRYLARHVVRPCSLTLNECLALADVVVSAVPSAKFKVPTAHLKEGCICVNVSSEKNFETNVKDKASLYLPAIGKVTIMMLLRNVLLLQQYRQLHQESVLASSS